MNKQYWLDNAKNINKNGWTNEIELIDGPHDQPEGVRKAEKIIGGIGLDKGKERNYVMVIIDDIPDIDVPVNEEAIEQNRKALDNYFKNEDD